MAENDRYYCLLYNKTYDDFQSAKDSIFTLDRDIFNLPFVSVFIITSNVSNDRYLIGICVLDDVELATYLLDAFKSKGYSAYLEAFSPDKKVWEFTIDPDTDNIEQRAKNLYDVFLSSNNLLRNGARNE